MTSGDLSTKEGIRQLTELAVSCGRKHQNEQTGFIHYFSNKEDEKDNGAIPVYENLLFALALMRSKHTETVQEGKAFIEKILPFQNFLVETGRGGFPIYLHEYPHCKERFLGIRLLPVFYAILNQFHHVIGSALKGKIIESVRALIKQCQQAHAEKPAPFTLTFTLGTATQALSLFLEDASLKEYGKGLVESLKDPQHDPSWFSPSSLSELLIALQMADVSSLPESWGHFWPYLSNTWHRESCAYVGPGWRDFQYCEEPQPTLYDLYMGFATGCYSYRAFVDHPFHLQAALINGQPASLPAVEENSKGEILGERWFAHNSHYGLCLLRKDSHAPTPGNDKGYAPFKLLWGDRTRAHSMVCQNGNIEDITYEWHPEGYIGMEVTLGPILNGEDKEKSREIVFYTEALEDTQFKVRGSTATTFKLGDEVSFKTGGMHVQLMFHCTEGSGNFMGHIMRGNRPAQIGLKGDHRFEAYDWQIYIRTIHRMAACKLKVDIKITKGE